MADALLGNALPLVGRKIDHVGPAARPLGARDDAAQRRTEPLLPRISAAEREAHRAFVATLGEKAIWNDYLAA